VLPLAVGSFALLAAIWIGYPVVVRLIALAVRPREHRWSGLRPTVSVIIATREGAEAIQRRVDDILRGSYPKDRLDVVVGSDARGGADPATVPVSGPVRVVRGDEPGAKAATLNAAVRVATGEILVFTDIAQSFAPDTITRLVDALADPRLGAVSGQLETGVSARALSPNELYWRLERWLRRNEARLHSAVGVTGAVYAMRRALYAPLPAGLILDDLYVPMRLVLRGHRVGFSETATALDERRFAVEKEYDRKVRTLTGVIQLCAWLPAVLVPIRNPIWLQFVFHKLLRFLTPYVFAVFVFASIGAIAMAVPRGAVLGAGAALGALAIAAVLVLAASRRARSAVRAGLLMQAALVKATMNGLRGRWDVWTA
jgi:cellulose synthase/poly-beta-1,6-N-acetylglucosamine synthase-like glycosyltransferase